MLLELDGQGALYRQVYRAVRRSILRGEIPAGTRLPATRSLAREAALSRNTILQAFDQLRVEGYVTGRTGAGTFVARELPEHGLAVGESARGADGPDDSIRAAQPARTSAAARRLAARAPGAARLSWSAPGGAEVCNFRYGVPAVDDFPIATWSRLLARRMRRASIQRLSYGAPGGCSELRQALARYLGRSRGVRCSPEQVILTYGTQQGVNLVADVLLDAGDRVAVEEPYYPGFTLPLEARGMRLSYVPIDEEGLRVAALARRPPVRLVCVTPSHQYPGGALMPLGRRLELLAFAERSNAFLLEDDYDSEFRYDGRPVECLQGLDRTGRVIYAGSASKLMFPSLRIGWLVVPSGLVDDFLRAKAVADTGTPGIEQLALADFIGGGHLERHLRRQRVRNAARRAALLEAIDRAFGDRAIVQGAQAGVHVLLWLRGIGSEHDAEVRRECRRRGVGVYSVQPSFRRPPRWLGLTLGYASLTEAQIRRGIDVLADVAAPHFPPSWGDTRRREANGKHQPIEWKL